MWIDPGIGFGKTLDHNLALLAHLDELVATGLPGAGRARAARASSAACSGASDGAADPVPTDDRLEGSLATATWAMACGVRMVRAHDVRAIGHAAQVVGGQIASDAA